MRRAVPAILRNRVPSPLRIGIAGLGAAGRTFVPAIRRTPEAIFAAVAEPDADTRQSLESSGDTQLFASLDEMLSRGAVDAVYVATPTPLHAEHVIRIAEA